MHLAASLDVLEMIANVLELRASIPQQQEMLRTYLADIDFPKRAKVLEVGCRTGAVARVVAGWPDVQDVVGVKPVAVPAGEGADPRREGAERGVPGWWRP